MTVAGKVSFIAGAASGIGTAVSMLAKKGSAVVLAGVDRSEMARRNGPARGTAT